ncbi:MAG: hypothetical protein IKE91_00075 [Clostridia bacterium]|nr:hypothetical protein [Clostridia bacterium]
MDVLDLFFVLFIINSFIVFYYIYDKIEELISKNNQGQKLKIKQKKIKEGEK